MAAITAHDGTFASRSASEPVARTVQRVASRGPLNDSAMAGLPHWYVGGVAAARTIVPSAQFGPEKRRTGR